MFSYKSLEWLLKLHYHGYLKPFFFSKTICIINFLPLPIPTSHLYFCFFICPTFHLNGTNKKKKLFLFNLIKIYIVFTSLKYLIIIFDKPVWKFRHFHQPRLPIWAQFGFFSPSFQVHSLEGLKFAFTSCYHLIDSFIIWDFVFLQKKKKNTKLERSLLVILVTIRGQERKRLTHRKRYKILKHKSISRADLTIKVLHWKFSRCFIRNKCSSIVHIQRYPEILLFKNHLFELKRYQIRGFQ